MTKPDQTSPKSQSDTDTLVVPSKEQFSEQAKMHVNVSDKLKEMVSSFEHHHETILSHLDSSQVAYYREWWKELKGQFLKQADLHEQLGKHLITAGDNYHDADQDIAQSLQGKASRLS